MKLNDFTVSYIETLATTAKMVGINAIIIEPPERVRGIDDNHSVVLFQEEFPELNIPAVGINRLDIFLQRLEIAKSCTNLTVNATPDNDNQFIRSFDIRGKGIKFDYRCANPTTIRAPKIINDEIVEIIPLNPESVDLMIRAGGAMGADAISFVSDDKGVSFEIQDLGGDKAEHTWHDVIDHKFSNKYPWKTITTLFKQIPNGEFGVGQKGILLVNVNNVQLYVLPKV